MMRNLGKQDLAIRYFGVKICSSKFIKILGCRKWGCNKWGFKGCLAALPGNRPKSAFFALFLPFRPFPEGLKSTWKIQKTEEKGLFLRYPQISLNPHLLNPHLRHPKNRPDLWKFRQNPLFPVRTDQKRLPSFDTQC